MTRESVAFSTCHPRGGKSRGREMKTEVAAARWFPWPTPSRFPKPQVIQRRLSPEVPTAHIRAVCLPPPFLLGLAATLGHSAPGRGQ